MKSNASGRVVPQPRSSSGCRPQNFFYNVHHQNQSQQQQQHQHHHQQQHNLSFHPHHHQQHQQQPPQHQNYAMLPCFNQHNTNGWAGIPLISTAASSNRRQRKPIVGGHRHLPPPPPPPAPPSIPSMSCNSLQIYNANIRDPQHSSNANDYDLNPMTRLAMHAQGAPLLLTGSYNRNRLNTNRQLRPLNPNCSEGYIAPCIFKPNGTTMHQKITKENNISGSAAGGCGGGGTGPGSGSNTHQSESAAVTCLPRIIKPRKRRKKDRKPLPNTNNFVNKNDHHHHEADTGVLLPNREHSQHFIGNQQQQHQHVSHLLPSHHQILGFNESETQCYLNKNNEPAHDEEDAQDTATGSICFCRQCDPVSRIWAFPLRRSHSDNSSDTTEFERATKNVGVIGSNRSSQVNMINNKKNNNTHAAGSLSDSSDSGYGDILSGIQIGDDFFRNNSDYLQLQKLPTDLLLSPTAESLLTESINEISRKLMETCDIKGAGTGGTSSPSSSSSASSTSSSSSSSDSCSVFSDSGLSSATSINNHQSGDELIFNFENLSINSLNHHHHHQPPNLLFPINNSNTSTSESMFDCFSTPDINNNTITHVPGDGGGGGSPRIDPQLFNCLDMLWGTTTQLPLPPSSLHSDAPKRTMSSSSSSSSSTSSSSSSSSSSSFYRSAVASM